MRVLLSVLATWGCSALPVTAVIRSPVDSQCQSLGLKGCPELVEGAMAYAEGNEPLARRKLDAARLKNTPEELARFAGVLREIASTTEAARPLADVAALLTESTPANRDGTAESTPARVALASAVSPAAAEVPSSTPGSAPRLAAPDRKAIAERLALYALTAREDPARRVSETIEVSEAPGSACQVAGSEAVCLRRQKGPFVVTDVVASEECGQRVLLMVSDSDWASPTLGHAWLLPARAQGVHGASFALRGGQWLYVAVKATRPSPADRACFVT